MEGKKARKKLAHQQSLLEAQKEVLMRVADFKMEDAVNILASALNECLYTRECVGNVVYRDAQVHVAKQ